MVACLSTDQPETGREHHLVRARNTTESYWLWSQGIREGHRQKLYQPQQRQHSLYPGQRDPPYSRMPRKGALGALGVESQLIQERKSRGIFTKKTKADVR